MVIHRTLTLHGPDEGRIQVRVSHNAKPGARQEADDIANRAFRAVIEPYKDDLHIKIEEEK